MTGPLEDEVRAALRERSPVPMDVWLVICPTCERRMIAGPELVCGPCRGVPLTSADRTMMCAYLMRQHANDDPIYRPGNFAALLDVRYGPVVW